LTRVLLIENDAPAMRLMAWALREEGFDVHTTTSDDAAQQAGEVQPHVIVFNTGEPDDAKRVCIEQLRSASEARIIDLGPASQSPRHESDADAYLNTPVTAQTLCETINRLATR
jgi:DNA-binding response OmpR family regulator